MSSSSSRATDILSRVLWAFSLILKPPAAGEVNYTMSRLTPRQKRTSFREMASRKWLQTNPGREDQVYVNESRWCWSGHRGQLQQEHQSWMLSFCMYPHTSAYKISCPLTISAGGLGLSMGAYTYPFPLWLPASKIHFPFCQPVLSNGFRDESRGTPLSVAQEASPYQSYASIIFSVRSEELSGLLQASFYVEP